MIATEAFWITIAGIASGFLAMVLRFAYKSKCKNISCLGGCCSIDRDVEDEIKFDSLQPVKEKEPATP